MHKKVLVLLAALLLMLAACGDDGDSTPEATETNNEATEDPGSQPTDDAAPSEVAVTGEEYAFVGAPDTLPAGPTTFTFQNTGKEPHEMVIFELKTDKSIEELLALPEKEAMKLVRIVGGTGAPPGKDAKQPVEADLTPGEYAIVCFVPAPDKKPHFIKGMVAGFEVL